MTTTCTWKIDAMECVPQQGNYNNVVITASWSCFIRIDNFRVALEQSVCTFTAPTENFIPYDQLTEQTVLNWCWANGIDKQSVENNVLKQLESRVSLPLPWNT